MPLGEAAGTRHAQVYMMRAYRREGEERDTTRMPCQPMLRTAMMRWCTSLSRMSA